MTNTTATVAAAKTLAKSNTAKDLNTQLDSLCKVREEWELGAYKTSNDQLYEILARCLDIYQQLRNDIKQRAEFKVRLDALKAQDLIKFNESTNLPTRIVRYIFRNSGKRSFAYAKALILATEEDIDSLGLAAWINKNNGVEQLRRRDKDGIRPCMREANFRTIAAAKFAESTSLLGSLRATDVLQPNPDSDHEFSVALLRKEADGTMSIVHGSNNAALVNRFLALAGKKLNGDQAEAIKTAAIRSDNAARDAILSEAA